MNFKEKVRKKLKELRKDKKQCLALRGYVSGPSEAEVEGDLEKIYPQIGLLEQLLKEDA